MALASTALCLASDASTGIGTIDAAKKNGAERLLKRRNVLMEYKAAEDTRRLENVKVTPRDKLVQRLSKHSRKPVSFAGPDFDPQTFGLAVASQVRFELPSRRAINSCENSTPWKP